MINQLKRHEVQVLLHAGHTQKDIARLAKVPVRTVRRIVEEPGVEHVDDDAERTRRGIGRPSIVEPFRTLVTTLLEQEPSMLSVELRRRARLEGYLGGKSALFTLVASLRVEHLRMTMRFEGLPGEFSQHDFGQVKVRHLDGSEETRNTGWVSVGIDHDTASFAARTILRWWRKMGRPAYPKANQLLITADAGGSNGPRVRLWKWEMQQLANRTGLSVTVCHFPPGTSKWNKIEHRLFSYISMNWRGQPLINLAVIVNLMASTRTAAGLRVRSELDKGRYPGGREIPDETMSTIKLQPHRFHGDWNYTIILNQSVTE